MRKLIICLLAFILAIGGCAHLPLVAVPQEEAGAFLADFKARMADRYEILSSVVFKFRFITLASLGMTAVDMTRDRLAVAGISPTGVTLFRVVVEKGESSQSFVMPELAKRGDVAKAVSGNIHDIYFNLIPEQPATMFRRGGKIFVRDIPRKGLETEYVFSQQDRMLAEKRCYRNGKLFWTVYYSGWFTVSDGKVHPGKVRLVQRAYGYQLIINTKEARPASDSL